MSSRQPPLSVVIVLLAFTIPTTAQFATIRRNLTNQHTLAPLRIFFATEGIHAVDHADSNQDGLPDQVEDIAKQTWAAYTLFIDVLKYPDPLQSERYREARFIDVHLLSKKILLANGVAYDGLPQIGRSIDPTGMRSICFDVATTVRATANLTPSHEMFHLIQNGATYFKTRWYTEGSARWAEHALGRGGVGRSDTSPTGSWPQSPADQAALFAKTYNSEFVFWNPLALLDDPKGDLPKLPARLAKLTYSNGDRVVQDRLLNGWQFMRAVLLEFGEADDLAFAELGYDSWTEPNQKSLRNSRFIHDAVMKVLKVRGHSIGKN
jgi:hypothetical protein